MRKGARGGNFTVKGDQGEMRPPGMLFPLQQLDEHGFLLVHLHHQHAFLFQLLHNVGKALEANAPLVEVGVGGKDIRLENGGIDPVKPAILIGLELGGKASASCPG